VLVEQFPWIAQRVLDQHVPSPRGVRGGMVTAILRGVRIVDGLRKASLLIDRHAPIVPSGLPAASRQSPTTARTAAVTSAACSALSTGLIGIARCFRTSSSVTGGGAAPSAHAGRAGSRPAARRGASCGRCASR